MLFDDGFLSDQVFKQGDQGIHRNNFVPTQVDDLVTGRLQGGNRPTCDIIHVGETARLFPIAVQV